MVEVTRGNSRHQLLRRGRKLEAATLVWNVVGVFVLAYAAIEAKSVALAGFGLDSLIEIGASTVVLWELAEVNASRQQRALRLIGIAFVGLAIYLGIQSTVVLVVGFHPHHSVRRYRLDRSRPPSSCSPWRWVRRKTGTALGNPVLQAEGRITVIDGILATAVLVGLVLNAALGWWWADPLAGYVLVYYAIREALKSLGTR